MKKFFPHLDFEKPRFWTGYDCGKLVQRMPFQGSSGWAWRPQHRGGGQIIQTVKYADDLVLMAKEETVLQGIIDKLI